MINTILITGGARSGKSTFAEELAIELNSNFCKNKIAYIATAEVTDEEFKNRILKHQERRGEEYFTYESPINLSDVFGEIINKHNVIIVECLATWLGNIYYKYSDNVEEKLKIELEKIVGFVREDNDRATNESKMLDILKNKSHDVQSVDSFPNINNSDKAIIFVTNEVGNGIVPDNKLARSYRDDLGYINKSIAMISDYVFSCTCGIPTRIK